MLQDMVSELRTLHNQLAMEKETSHGFLVRIGELQKVCGDSAQSSSLLTRFYEGASPGERKD